MSEPILDTDVESARIRSAISAAVADVDACGLVGSDRPVAFGLSLATRLGTTTGFTSQRAASTHTTPADDPVTPDPPRPVPMPADALSRAAESMKVPREVLELVYDARDGELIPVVAARMLASDKAGATRQLAQLVAGGRQAAGIEDWTSMGTVRAVVADYGKLDSNNFASYITKLDDVFRFTGKGSSREMKVTRPGMEKVADLVRSLSGTS